MVSSALVTVATICTKSILNHPLSVKGPIFDPFSDLSFSFHAPVDSWFARFQHPGGTYSLFDPPRLEGDKKQAG